MGYPFPAISSAQNLLRLKSTLEGLPTPLLKHVHLSKIRREDPDLYFACLQDDLPNV